MRRRISILTGLIACVAWIAPAANAPAQAPVPPSSPQRMTAEAWVNDIDARHLHAACELQTVGYALGFGPFEYACSALPEQEAVNCPAFHEGAKPPYRKSEVRTVAEQVGEYTEETATRGFVAIDAQVKARRQWGTLGLEQAEGVWRVTYLRYRAETFMPAGNALQAWPAFYRLWISNWCPTDHPKWEQTKR